MKRKLSRFLNVVMAISLTSVMSIADDSDSNSIEIQKSQAVAKESAKKSSKAEKSKLKSVEMFEAMDQKLITVDYIGKDATEANLIFRNQGNEPVNVILPATFGAVPVLAQGGPAAGPGFGQGAGFGPGQQGGGGGQGIGGGLGGVGVGGGQGIGGGQGFGAGGGQGQFGAQRGLLRVEPDKPRKLTVATVCLNHGKTDPNPRMKYQVVRLADLNDSAIVEQLCSSLGAGKVSQNVAQAAAWHVANGLTWEELAKKPKVISDYTGVQLFFSHFEVQAAIRLTEKLQDSGKKSSRYSDDGNESSTDKKVSVAKYRSTYSPISRFAK